MKREQRFFLIWRYVTFFLLIAFVITCSFFLFFHSMELDKELIRRNAPLTFLNILLAQPVLLWRGMAAAPLYRRQAHSAHPRGDPPHGGGRPVRADRHFRSAVV